MWGGCGDRVGGCLNQGAAVGLLLPVAFVFLVVEGGGSAAVTAFGVGGAAVLGVGGVPAECFHQARLGSIAGAKAVTPN